MHRKTAGCRYWCRGDTMKKKQDDSAAHELRDCPVPPVKGAITDGSDLRPKPEQAVSDGQVHFGDSAMPESWL